LGIVSLALDTSALDIGGRLKVLRLLRLLLEAVAGEAGRHCGDWLMGSGYSMPHPSKKNAITSTG
jgi:hypothetical protein